jgi:CDP-diacylglycerol--serine O-phosphatidyltransferase
MAEENKINISDIKKRGAVVLPSIFTLLNMAFGFFSILSTSDKEYLTACYFIIASYLMDALDGRVARLVHGESKFGIEFDSFSDWLSFGIAPAYLMYNFALKEYGFWAYPVSFLYVLCGALRLARFNIKSLSGESSKKFFQGLPIPGAAGIIVSFVMSYIMLESEEVSKNILIISSKMPFIYGIFPFIMIAISLLMVSSVPYAAFKGSNIPKLKSISGLVIVISIISLVIAYPQNALFLFFSIYAISGIIYGIYMAIFSNDK